MKKTRLKTDEWEDRDGYKLSKYINDKKIIINEWDQ